MAFLRTPMISRNCRGQLRRLSTNERIFRENDIVVLRLVKDPDRFFLTKPLNYGRIVATHQGDVKHDDIIDKPTRISVFSSKGTHFRAHFPTTDEYVTRSRRLVTPIYPQDAATIVDLLDIHVDQYLPNMPRRGPPLEILEAGTGHGSLTIALAKEIQAANPPALTLLKASDTHCPSSGNSKAIATTEDTRNAIIHTVDISSEHSKHAQQVISNFRRGMYSHHINFYSGHNPTSWIEFQRKSRQSEEPFLSIVILDLPSPEDYLKSICRAVHADGMLGVFCPSITQIGEVVKMIKENSYPLMTEKVVEIANNGGLKQWDVRMAKLKQKQARKLGEVKESVEKMVCRPKVGDVITGGGFFAIFRKKDEPVDKTAEAKTKTGLGEIISWFRKLLKV